MFYLTRKKNSINICMLKPTSYIVNTSLFQEAWDCLPTHDMKTIINKPTGNFFYDPWELKDEYKGTVWEKIYNSLSVSKGETRIIILGPGKAYQIHSDIDDRYHLNISGEACYLIDLDQKEMFLLSQDGIWYDMNAGPRHTAAHFGRIVRVQLLARHLLKNNKLVDPVEVELSPTITNTDDARFLFDNSVSFWLNTANKNGFINNFSCDLKLASVKFNIEQSQLTDLRQHLPPEVKIT